jgi:CoA-binding domain
MVLAIPLAEPLVLSRFGERETTTAALMNTHQNYTLASRPQTSRALRSWAVLARGTFSGAIFLTDVALIVAMSCLTGIAYHLAAYREHGHISSYVQLGVLAASIFAVSNLFRREYRLPNFFNFKAHGRRTIQLWNVTLICLLMLGFLAQISVDYSRAWIVLFYITTLAALIVERYAIVRVTAMARAAGLTHHAHARRRAGDPAGAPERSAADQDRPLAAALEYRRGPAALQRAHRRHVARRPTPACLVARPRIRAAPDRHRRQCRRVRLGLADARRGVGQIAIESDAPFLDRGGGDHRRQETAADDRLHQPLRALEARHQHHLRAAALVGDRDDRSLRRDLRFAAGRNPSRARWFCTNSRKPSSPRSDRSRACN